MYKNDRCVKSKYVEWGLSKKNPRVFMVISSIDNKDLVRDTLIELVSTIDNKELVNTPLKLVEEKEDTRCTQKNSSAM